MLVFNKHIKQLNTSMRFNDLVDKIQPTLLLERYYRYNFPDDPALQMYDFYVLDFLKEILGHPSESFRDLPVDLVDSVNNAVEVLYPNLRQELLNSVFYAICAETRHIDQRAVNISLLTTNKVWWDMYKFYSKYRKFHGYDISKQQELTDEWDVEKPHSDVRPPEKEQNKNYDQTKQERNISFKAANYAIKKTGTSSRDFVDLANKVFKDGRWSYGYGGTNWGKICDGWILLNTSDQLDPKGRHIIPKDKVDLDATYAKMAAEEKKAKEDAKNKSKAPEPEPEPEVTQATPDNKSKSEGGPTPMGVAIDHVYDLQHNNDTVFNKLQAYQKDSEYKWIEATLDFKANVKSYFELLQNCSGVVKMMAQPILYNKLGQTWENTIKTTSPDNINVDDYNLIEVNMDNVKEIEQGDFVVWTGYPTLKIKEGVPYRVLMKYKATNKLGRGNSNLLIAGDDGKPVSMSYTGFSKVDLHSPKKVVLNAQAVDNTQAVDDAQDGGDTQFKVGDKVTCIDKKYNVSIKVGNEYTVSKVRSDDMIYIENDIGNFVWYSDDQFKLTKDYVNENQKLKISDVKVGDTVECITGEDNMITKGKKYKVTELVPSQYGEDDCISIVSDGGYTVTKFIWKFKKSDEQEPDVKQSEPLDKSEYKIGSMVSENDYGDIVSAQNTKVGDLIVCVDEGPGTMVSRGTAYEVNRIDIDWVHIWLDTARNDNGYFKCDRFRTIKQTVTPNKTTYKAGDIVDPSDHGDMATPKNTKIGDLVVCIKDSPPHNLNYGIAYEVQHISTSLISLKSNGTAYTSRFKTIKGNPISIPDDFRVGDVVKCIRPAGPLKGDVLYTITYTQHNEGEPLFLTIKDEFGGKYSGWNVKRFVKVDDTKPSQLDSLKKSMPKPKLKVGDSVIVHSKTSNLNFYGTLEEISNGDGLVKFPPQHGNMEHSEWFDLNQITRDFKI